MKRYYGGEFINQHLIRYCQEQQMTFCRSRPQRKNDNCYVEQKNYSVVRRAVGYGRDQGAEPLDRLNQLYAVLRLQINFFKPVMKLLQKQRVGSRVRRRYDRPQTPYQRLMESDQISDAAQAKLHQQYQQLNPAELARHIGRLQQALLMQCPPGELELLMAKLHDRAG